MKRLKILWFAYLASWTLLFGWSGHGSAQEPDSGQDNVIFRIQFQGSQQFSGSTNAPTFKKIWNLPSTKSVLSLAMDKLAKASTRFYPSVAEKDQAGLAALIRPLLDDFLVRESLVELRGPTNQVHWLAAVRADAATAARWDQQLKQLTSKLSLNQVQIVGGPETKGWLAKSEVSGFSMKIIRTKHWIAVMGGADPQKVFQEVDNRLAKLQSPGPDLGEQLATVNMKPAQVAFWLPALDWLRLPPLKFTAKTGGEYIRSHLELNYPQPHMVILDDWDIPYGSIRNPQNSLASFMAVRGIRNWLHGIPGLADMKPEELPNQLCSWGQSQFGGQTLINMPLNDVTNTLKILSTKIPRWISSTFTNSYTKIFWAPNRSELIWQGLPILVPFIRPLQTEGKTYLFAGLVPALGATNPPTPVKLFSELKEPDIFYYNWEITERRLMHNRHYVQLGLIVDRRQAMQTNDLTFRWIQNIHEHLGNSVTVGSRVSETKLQLERKSHLGLTGSELVLLTQWLNTPDFPYAFKFPGIAKPPQKIQDKLKALEEQKKRRKGSKPGK